MKKLLFIIFFNLLIVANAFSQFNFANNSLNRTSINSKKSVLLELFTSESCFACPPAEMLLAKFEKSQPFDNANLITLEFHVDYMDSFGRKDKLASPLFSQRQRVYDRKFRTGKIYTPQMIIDGNIQFAGTNLKKAKKAVRKTIKKDKGQINLTFKDKRLNVKILNLPKHDYATVYLAIAEDRIITRNRKSIDEANVSIVRRLNGLGRILPEQKVFEMEAGFQIQKDWKKKNVKLIVFVQENGTRNVLAVDKINLNSSITNDKIN